ncbi:MAG TPA: hypothetical protein VK914_07155 [bacterium]|jgi:hypothetical protein|nr:hypothetical protein [bacterium]
MVRLFTPFRLACAALVPDLLWTVQALSRVPRHAGSNVSMVSLVLWVLFHLPATLLASLVFYAAGSLQGPVSSLPAWCLAALGLLGLAQTFALAYGLALWRGGKA